MGAGVGAAGAGAGTAGRAAAVVVLAGRFPVRLKTLPPAWRRER